MRIVYILTITTLTLILLFFAFSFIYRIFISPPVDTEIPADNGSTKKEQTIQVEILNGTKIGGLAKKTMEFLRKRHFDVLSIGNWSNDSMQTTIIFDNLGNIAASKKVAEALGIPDSLIILRIDSSLLLNTTIVIGYDYKRMKPFK